MSYVINYNKNKILFNKIINISEIYFLYNSLLVYPQYLQNQIKLEK